MMDLNLDEYEPGLNFQSRLAPEIVIQISILRRMNEGELHNKSLKS